MNEIRRIFGALYLTAGATIGFMLYQIAFQEIEYFWIAALVSVLPNLFTLAMARFLFKKKDPEVSRERLLLVACYAVGIVFGLFVANT